MKLHKKIFISISIALLMVITMIAPAFADIDYVRGYCGTHECLGTLTGYYMSGGTMETQVLDYTYGYVYAKVRLKVFTGMGTYEYIESSGSDSYDFIYEITKRKRSTDVLIKTVTGTSAVSISGSSPSFNKSVTIITYPD